MHAPGRLAARLQTRDPDGLLWLVTFLVTVAIALVTIHPFRDYALGSDSASSVLYFQRISGGRTLEAFLGTTPKPLLTVVYGALHGLTGDWRSIGLLATVVYGFGVATTTVLVRRTAGSLIAAAFVATALVATWQLFQEASLGYAGVWLLAGCAVAGLAVLGRRPRYAVAGVALLVGSLARQEGLFVTAFAVATLVFLHLRGRRGGPRPSRDAWLLALGVLAVPLTALHDWLLAGDPTYSLHVQALGVAGRPVLGLGGTIDLVVRHVLPATPLVALAAVGLVVIIRERHWTILVGLLALGPAVLGLILFVGWRNLIVLERYLLPVDIAIAVAAAFAVGEVARLVLQRLATVTRSVAGARTVVAVGCAAAVLGALAVTPRVGPLDQRLLARIALESGAIADLSRVRRALEQALETTPGIRDPLPDPDPGAESTDRIALLVPPRFLPQLAVDLRLGLDRVARLDAGAITDDGSYPRPGWLVLMQRGLVSGPESATANLRVDVSTVSGSIRVDPLVVVDDRTWLVRIHPAG